jgi:hypothetical protein
MVSITGNDVDQALYDTITSLRREHVALLARVEQLTRLVTDLESAQTDEYALARCRHCNKIVEDGGSEHEDCRINEREMWGSSGRPDFRY